MYANAIAPFTAALTTYINPFSITTAVSGGFSLHVLVLQIHDPYVHVSLGSLP